MAEYKFGACEWNFPVWGSLAIEMAHDAGYDGIEICDGGGWLQPHPMNQGNFVEVERLMPNKIRLDDNPLSYDFIRDDYMEAAARTGMELTGIYLYFLNHQGFVSSDNESATGKDALETIKNAIIGAEKMGISTVSVPTKGMFGIIKNKNALDKLEYAIKVGEEHGIKIVNSFDTILERELELLKLFEGKLKVDFNTIDPVCYYRTPAPEMIRTFGKENIGRVKIKDLIADKEGFITHEGGKPCLIGQGDSDWMESVKALKEIGYEGWIFSDTPFTTGSLLTNGETYDSLAAKDLITLKNAFK